MSIFFGPGGIGVCRSDPDALPAHGRSTTARRKPRHESHNQTGTLVSFANGENEDVSRSGGIKVLGTYTGDDGKEVKTVYTEVESVNANHTTHAVRKPVEMLGFTLFPRYLNKDLYNRRQIEEANGNKTLSEAIIEGVDNIIISCPVPRFHRYAPKSPIEFFFSQSKPSPTEVSTSELRASHLQKMFSHGPNHNEWQQEIILPEVFASDVKHGTLNMIPYAIQLNIHSFDSSFHCECFIEASSYVKLPPPGSSSGDTVFTGMSVTDQHLQSWVDIGGYSPSDDGKGDKVREMHIPLTNRHTSSVRAFVAPDSYNDAMFTRWISIPIETMYDYLKSCPTIDLNVQTRTRGGDEQTKSIKFYQFELLKDIPDANNLCQWLYAENRTNLLRQLESYGVVNTDKFNTVCQEESQDNLEFMPVPVILFDYLIAGFVERFNLNNIVMPLDKLRVVIRPLHKHDLQNEIKKTVPIAPSFTLGVQIAYDLYNVKGVSDSTKPGEIAEQLRKRGIAMRHFLDIAAAGQPTNIFAATT